MIERTAAIPLDDKTASYIHHILEDGIIVKRGERDFGELGTFTVKSGLLIRVMWAQKLLDYNPEKRRLSVYRGQLIVRELDNTVLKSIPPQEIRRVDSAYSEMGIVRESGYVLANHLYSVGERGRISVEEFEEILESADNGQEPLDFSPYPRVKVDPTLIGRKLWICLFEPDLDSYRSVWDIDGVVVDPETRKLVDREILHPLSLERWGKKQAE